VVEVVLQQADEETTVAPEQGHVGVRGTLKMEYTAEVPLRLLKGYDLVDQSIEPRNFGALDSCGGRKSADVSAGEVATVLSESTLGRGFYVGKQKVVRVSGRFALEHPSKREIESLIKLK